MLVVQRVAVIALNASLAFHLLPEVASLAPRKLGKGEDVIITLETFHRNLAGEKPIQ